VTRKWRRRELLQSGLAAAAAALLAACGRKLQRTPTPLEQGPPTSAPTLPPATARPSPTVTRAEEGAARPTSTPRPTYPPFAYASDVSITPIEGFYAYTYHPQPPPELPDFRLRIFGHVHNELSLSLEDLLAMPVVEEMRTLECISNPVGGSLIGNAVWRGVPTAHLLELAGVLPRAVELKFECGDGYHTSVPVELALDPHSFLAYWMNGVPLPAKHGYPLRALWPGRYGQKQPKWITGIELIDQPHLGHWERQGWSNAAIIVPNSRIDHPKKQDVVQLPVTISGIAFANQSGVAQVEVSTDDGRNWHQAELIRPPSPLAWTEWRYTWAEAEPGSHVIRARVTDGEGRRQRMGNGRLLGGIKPDGTDLQHRVAVTTTR
jgi:DMSO/TMAO reductase YedYZ molybdopterin-dependent catalytic subunit